jgi:integrase/recombinase XerC
MGQGRLARGSAGLHLAREAVLLRPEEQVLEAMLDGMRAQHLARNVAFSTIEKRLAAIWAFTQPCGRVPVGVKCADGR